MVYLISTAGIGKVHRLAIEVDSLFKPKLDHVLVKNLRGHSSFEQLRSGCSEVRSWRQYSCVASSQAHVDWLGAPLQLLGGLLSPVRGSYFAGREMYQTLLELWSMSAYFFLCSPTPRTLRRISERCELCGAKTLENAPNCMERVANEPAERRVEV